MNKIDQCNKVNILIEKLGMPKKIKINKTK
jgi:hypothetical protein